MFTRDRLSLLFWAIVVSALGWVYFHYMGKYAHDLLSLFLIVSTYLENRRLRKELKKLQPKNTGHSNTESERMQI